MATKRADADSGAAGYDPKWEPLEDGVHKDRYTSPEFARLESEKLWPHVWQMACRMDEIPRPGDYTVYEIVDQEILVIRQADDSIKAYHNVCPHRATALAVGSGRFSTGEITCPFHGWRWNLEGDNTFVLDRDEFKGGCLGDEDVKLKECQVATFVGCVFINMDANCMPFDEFIAPVRERLEGLKVPEMKFYWQKSIVVPANWKIAQEAFFEGYHVAATHPQLNQIGREMVYGRKGKKGGNESSPGKSAYESFPNGHGRFYSGKHLIKGDAEPFSETGDPVEDLILSLTRLEEGMDAMVLMEEVNVAKSMRNRPIPEGSTLGEEFMKAIFENYNNQGRPVSDPTPENMEMWGGEIFIFPNYLILPHFANALCYRSRPMKNNPDWCIFEIFSIKTYPEGETPPRPKVEYCTNGTDPEQYRLIPRQDMANIPRMQKGLHSHGFEYNQLADYQEQTILNMHREEDKYLKA